MPADLTVVTELATALGTLPGSDLAATLRARPAPLRLDEATWDRLDHLYRSGAHSTAFASAYRNGRSFAAADEGLAGRPPRLVEWTGGRRPSGDEVAPIDLRIDHVYLISCKYLSANVANASPARLFDGLLATSGHWDRTDWYLAIAPVEYQALYRCCVEAAGVAGLPARAADLDGPGRERLRRALPGRRYPAPAEEPYHQLCRAVSARSADRWREGLGGTDPERVLWRLLRIGNAPYFLLGAHGTSRLLLRIDTAWDWHHAFRLDRLTVAPADAGQPRVDWRASCRERATGAPWVVEGHVEIRWSHGRFGQPPEAKVYLDTPADQVPGYHPLDAGSAQRGQDRREQDQREQDQRGQGQLWNGGGTVPD